MTRIVLIGFMGAGKTTVGMELARKTGCRFLDTDRLIEEEQGCTISEIFETKGEQAFRDLETALLKKLPTWEDDFVLSVGGGTPVREENRVLLQNIGTVIYLKTSKETLLKRLSEDKDRPLLQGGTLEEKISTLMENRASIYESAAHKMLETDNKDIEQLVCELQQYK